MSDITMGAAILLTPQFEKQEKREEPPPKITAICLHCGAQNEYPYNYCKECGKPAKQLHEFKTCPYCGEKLILPKQPNFCPYCSEKLV